MNPEDRELVELDDSDNEIIVKDSSITALEDKVNADAKAIVTDIINTEQGDELKDLIQLFNMNTAKKNVLRVNKLNELVDAISDEMLNRIKNGDEISNKDLQGFLSASQNTLDKSSKVLDINSDTPSIQFNTQNNNITISTQENELTRQERENVLGIVSAILNASKQSDEQTEEEEE